MADGKKSFVLYCDLIHTVRKMPKDKVADLFLTILAYVNDENPVVEDYIIDLVFEPIKHQLKRDLKKWESERVERKDSGQLGNLSRWHPDLYEQVIKKQLNIEDAVKIIKSRKSHSDKHIASGKELSHSDENIAVTATATVNATVNATATTNGKYPMLATSAVGGEKVKKIATGVWSDKIWVESISQGLELTAPVLKKWMALFNASVAEDYIEDFTEKRYKRMIRGWILKQKEKGIILEDWLQKISSSAPLKKLNQ